MFGPGEHQDLSPVLRTNGVRQQFPLSSPVNLIHDLIDAFGRFAVRGNADLRRRVQEICRQAANFF